MEKRKVSVEQRVEQVLDGSHYKGYLKIANTRIDYELVLEIPIAQLNSIEPAKDEDEIRRRFKITVKRDNANIELSRDEYGFFLSMLVELAVDFYNTPQVRDSNKGIIGATLRGKGPLAPFDVSASIAITRSASYGFSPELCAMLSAPKFGCALVA